MLINLITSKYHKHNDEQVDTVFGKSPGLYFQPYFFVLVTLSTLNWQTYDKTAALIQRWLIVSLNAVHSGLRTVVMQLGSDFLQLHVHRC